VRDPRLFASLTATLTVLSLGLAACGSDEGGSEGGESEALATIPEEEAETWPLTGLEVGKGHSALDHPVLVAKMDNTEASAPQQGLGAADLVVEELVEGGVTRLAAFYYSALPSGPIGPVRSMRASDIGIVAPADGVMVTSGAAGVTINRIKDAGITYYAEGGPGFFREAGRSAPYNLFTDLDKVAEAASDGEEARPEDYLPWGSADDLPEGQPARTLTADFGAHSTSWVFQGGQYVNQNSFAADGDEFQADNVLVMRVEVGDAGYLDPAGNTVPETMFQKGAGEALLFHDGQLVRGTWSKDGPDAPIRLSTKAGELTVPAGRTWIELVPVDAANGSVTFGK